MLDYDINDLFNPKSPASVDAPTFTTPPSAQNAFSDGIDPATLTSGAMQGNTTVQDGFVQSSNYVSGSAGWKLFASGAIEALSATINGIITAISGAIGGFSIGADYLRDAANSFGLASTVTGGDDVRFWAGDTFANRATAPFNVTEAGAVSATKLTVTGYNTSFVQVPLSKSYTAGSSIAANDALYGTLYQSDGGVLLDASASGTAVTDGSGNGSISFSVGNNSNRVLVFALCHATFGSSVAQSLVKYNNVAMTAADDTGGVNGSSWVLVAPTTGSHSLTFTAGASASYDYII